MLLDFSPLEPTHRMPQWAINFNMAVWFSINNHLAVEIAFCYYVFMEPLKR